MPFEHLQALSSPESNEDFSAALWRLCEAAGAEHYLAVRLRGVDLDQVVQVMHNGPAPEAVNGMRHWSMVRLLDALRASALPVVFGPGAAPAPEVAGFAAGVACKAVEPRGAVVIVLSKAAAEPLGDDTMPLMQTALLAAHHSVAGLRKLHALACPLSERELECLQLAFAAELSSREIAKRLQISARTVEHYLEQGRAKLGVDSTLAAGVKAVDQGWMDLLNSGPIEIAG
jgi:DNA-binding CsgD family transcriptional regulator